MNKLTVFIEGNKRTLYLDPCINKKSRSVMVLKNLTVYLKFKNAGGYILSGTQKILFEEGYWTFAKIKKRLAGNNIKLELVGMKSKIYLEMDLNLRGIGKLLGFPEGKLTNSRTWETSPGEVDVNKGLRYVTINCDLIDSNQNFNSNGARSCTLVTVPIPTNQLLNGTNSFYKDVDSQVVIKNESINRIYFSIHSNISETVGVDVLFDLYNK